MAASLAAACQTSGSHIERLDKLKQVYGRDKADWHEIQGLVFAAQLILNRPTLSNQAVAEAQKVLVIALEIANVRSPQSGGRVSFTQPCQLNCPLHSTLISHWG